MTRREKIAICVVVLSIAYGLFSFPVITGNMVNQSMAAEIQMSSLEIVLQNVDDRLTESEYTEVEQYSISQMQTPWERDPFYNKESPFHSEIVESSTSERSSSEYAYTGYVMIGERKMAIIDGHEYQMGEELKSGKFMVTEILPTRVVMKANSKNMAEGEAEKIPERLVIELIE